MEGGDNMNFLEVMSPSLEIPFELNNKTHTRDIDKRNSFKEFLNTALLNNNNTGKNNKLNKVIVERTEETNKLNDDMTINKSESFENKKSKAIETGINLNEKNKIIEKLDVSEKELEAIKLEEVNKMLEGSQLISEEILLLLQKIIGALELQINSFKEIEESDTGVIALVDDGYAQSDKEVFKLLNQMLGELKQINDKKPVFENNAQIKNLLMKLEGFVKAKGSVLENNEINNRDTSFEIKSMESLSIDYETAEEKTDIKNRDSIDTKGANIEKLDNKEKNIPDIVLEKDYKKNDAGGTKDYEENIAIVDRSGKVDILKNQKFDIIAKQAETVKVDVFEQITSKIRLVSREDYSEIRIQLKPDNLGKLLLKVVLEKGELIAKFTAENNHVKEIIESNFSELKDSLQERGINVHSLSVSVGNEKRWRNNENNQPKGTVRQKGLKSMEIEDIDYYQEKVNPYSIKEGTLDIKV